MGFSDLGLTEIPLLDYVHVCKLDHVGRKEARKLEIDLWVSDVRPEMLLLEGSCERGLRGRWKKLDTSERQSYHIGSPGLGKRRCALLGRSCHVPFFTKGEGELPPELEGMLCASYDAPTRRLPRSPARRPSRGGVYSMWPLRYQVSVPIEMVSCVQYAKRVSKREPLELFSRVAFIPAGLGTAVPASLPKGLLLQKTDLYRLLRNLELSRVERGYCSRRLTYTAFSEISSCRGWKVAVQPLTARKKNASISLPTSASE
ncbi:hypothetical protein BHM03_00033028 [Ensete ventricosum]|nr:hypothetical protein BHM03_00033028 [Ensete ventricosum]